MKIDVIKASGKTEPFNLQKLVSSLIHCGASEDIAFDIAKKVESQVANLAHTRHIYRLAKRLLRQYNHATSMRYSLKKALSLIGPSGYPFEKFFARVLLNYGYSVEVNRILQGYCVSHEVDVLAGKGNERYVIECKYHSDGGKSVDIKTALYVNSRFLDIQKAFKIGSDLIISKGWLVTNTRCTLDAIKYAECVDLEIVSWKYPHGRSLEKMIEYKKLYPVSVLSPLKKSAIEALFKEGIILVVDMLPVRAEELSKVTGIDVNASKSLKRQAEQLYGI
jgi:hypothetical protein